MNITIDLPIKDEQQKKELEQYLREQAKKFLLKKKDVVELVEVDYDDVPDEIKKSFDKVEKEYKENGLKNFTFIPMC